MEILGHDWTVGHRKCFIRAFVSGIGGRTRPRKSVAKQDCELVGKTPEFACDDIRPAGHRMKKHDPCFCRGDANITLCKRILPVGTDSAEALRLSFNANVSGKEF
jgi:hypothetical protein